MTERWERDLQALREVHAPRSVADRVAQGPRTDRPAIASARKRVTAMAVAFAIAVAGTLLVVKAFDTSNPHPANLATWPGGTNVLPIPAPGRAAPAFLADGSPIFVVTTEGGSTHVFSAVSTHKPYGIGELIGWCPGSQTFLDPLHGSMWFATGTYLAGPAPTGLVPFGFTVLAGGELRVGTPLAPPARGVGARTPITGPFCNQRGVGTSGMVSPAGVPPSAIQLSPQAATHVSTTSWIAVRGMLVVTSTTAQLCPGVDRSCRNGATVRGIDAPGLLARQIGLEPYTSKIGIWLAHVHGSYLVDLTVAAPVAKGYLPVFFTGTTGWHIQDSGRAPVPWESVAWASTVRFDQADLAPNAPAIPPATIAGLPPNGIIVTALVVPSAYDPSKGAYPPGALDGLDLSKARVRGPTAEEPPGSYTVIELPNGYVLVRVYFGTSAPSAALVRKAQAELDTLQIPPVCPVPPGAYQPVLSVTSGPPGTQVTVSGPVSYQGMDGTYEVAKEQMQVWWNFQSDNSNRWTDLLPGGASPSPANSGAVTMVTSATTDGVCSWQASFAVPDVPAGAYPITVLIVSGPSATSGGSLIFHVTAP